MYCVTIILIKRFLLRRGDRMGKLKLHEILTDQRLDSEERRAVDSIYRFLEKNPSTIAKVSRLAYGDKLFVGFPHHANYVDSAISVLEKNGIIESDSLGIYHVRNP